MATSTNRYTGLGPAMGFCMRMVLFFTICLITAGFCTAGQNGSGNRKQGNEKSGAPYWYSSETAPWYDSYGRLQHGYKDAPMKQYPSRKEPYYYANETTPWYDSYGRLRYGPNPTFATEGVHES